MTPRPRPDRAPRPDAYAVQPRRRRGV